MKAATRGPLRALPDPILALRQAAARIPAFRDGTWTPLDLTPRRYEVRKDGGVDLACTVRFRDAAGREQLRPLLIQPREGGEPRFFLSPDDPAMPGLAERLEELKAALGPGTMQVLAHRFGRRVTLRWTRDLILKVYARSEDDRAAGMLRTLAAAGLPFRTPALVAHLPGDRLVVQTVVPGASAHDVLRSGSDIPAVALGRGLIAARNVTAGGLRGHRLPDELAVVRKLAGRAAAVDPEIADELVGAAEAFSRTVAAGAGAAVRDAEPLVFSHRDLHDKQILCDGPSLGLIDWDLAALAPETLDPGNFLAHLTLRSLQGRIAQERAEATRAAFLEGLGAAATAAVGDARLEAPPMRDLHNWVSVALLRLVGVYALRPGWPGLPRRILAAFHQTQEAA